MRIMRIKVKGLRIFFFHIAGARQQPCPFAWGAAHGSRAGGNQAAQGWAKAFYRSKRWLKCRDAYRKDRMLADGGLCEECHDRPGCIVHHREPLTQETITNPEISLNHRNLEYVCKDCHDRFEGHGIGGGSRPLCRFGGGGQPISMREMDRYGRKH